MILYFPKAFLSNKQRKKDFRHIKLFITTLEIIFNRLTTIIAILKIIFNRLNAITVILGIIFNRLNATITILGILRISIKYEGIKNEMNNEKNSIT